MLNKLSSRFALTECVWPAEESIPTHRADEFGQQRAHMRKWREKNSEFIYFIYDFQLWHRSVIYWLNDDSVCRGTSSHVDQQQSTIGSRASGWETRNLLNVLFSMFIVFITRLILHLSFTHSYVDTVRQQQSIPSRIIYCCIVLETYRISPKRFHFNVLLLTHFRLFDFRFRPPSLSPSRHRHVMAIWERTKERKRW